MTQPSIIHADLDAFFASVEQKLNQALRGKPVIVTNTDPQGRLCNKGIVSTCSYEARKFGVHSGMGVWQAKQFCPNGVYVKGNFSQYEKHSREFFEVLGNFSCNVEPISIDEGFVDLKACDLLYPDFAKLAKIIKQTVKEKIGLNCSLGLASSRVVAKVASDFNKPNGLTIVPLGLEKDFLAPLPLRDLPGIGAKTEAVFKTFLGINATIGDLANLSSSWVEKNLGQSGLNLWQAANGKDSIWFQTRNEPQKSISRSVTFDHASDNHLYILAHLRLLIEKVSQQLFENDLTTTCVSVVIRTQQFQNSSIEQTCQPLWQAKEIYYLAKKLFWKVYKSPFQLRLIGIGASHLSPKNLQLFVQDEKKLVWLAKSLKKARDKYGFSTILPASNLII